ncbi:MAG: hypothetical protein V1799_07700 [bacterium]
MSAKLVVMQEEARVKQLIWDMFLARMVREFGERHKTINAPQDPTDSSSVDGFLLFDHPILGPLHYQVIIGEGFGIYSLTLYRPQLIDEPQIPEIVESPDDGWPMQVMNMEEVRMQEANRFDNYNVRFHMKEVVNIDSRIFEVMEWILRDPFVQASKKPFSWFATQVEPEMAIGYY